MRNPRVLCNIHAWQLALVLVPVYFIKHSVSHYNNYTTIYGILTTPPQIAMCDRPLREISNPGASGSLFYLSVDDAFIIKTVQKKEAHFLQKLLPGYYLVSSKYKVQSTEYRVQHSIALRITFPICVLF